MIGSLAGFLFGTEIGEHQLKKHPVKHTFVLIAIHCFCNSPQKITDRSTFKHIAWPSRLAMRKTIKASFFCHFNCHLFLPCRLSLERRTEKLCPHVTSITTHPRCRPPTELPNANSANQLCFTPCLPLFVHRYICKIRDILQLCPLSISLALAKVQKTVNFCCLIVTSSAGWPPCCVSQIDKDLEGEKTFTVHKICWTFQSNL